MSGFKCDGMTMTMSASASSPSQIMIDDVAKPAAETPPLTNNCNTNSASDRDQPMPPWQFRWKRPRWDRVESDIDFNHFNEKIDNENDSTDIEIDESWTPISNASVVLTRREAQKVIGKLHRRKELMYRQEEKRRSSQKTGSNDILESTQKAAGRKEVSLTPLNLSHFSSPFASWWKSITSPGDNKTNISHRDKENANNCNKINTIPCINGGKPPIISISSSPSTYKPNDNFGHHTHYNDDDADNLSPPSSPTSFSTFSLQPTPKKNNNINCKMPLQDTIENDDKNDRKEDWSGNDDDDNDDDGGYGGVGSSPLIVSDASMASSLLWGEDMTLTTVSEDEAAAYRLHQQSGGAAGTNPSFGVGWGLGDGDGMDNTYGKSYSGGERCYGASTTPAATTARNRILSFPSTVGCQPRRGQPIGLLTEELGGYDHVVLSVTIFATASATPSSSSRNAGLDENQRSGEVVVMELLSTANPPLPGSTPPMTMSAPPPPASSQLPPRRREEKYTSPVASNAVNSADTDNRDQRDDDDNTDCNHTRLLARRVLWWPSSILSESSDARNRCNGADDVRDISDKGAFPSFVSLGRTSIWKHMDEHQVPSNLNDEGEQNNGHKNRDCEKKVQTKECSPASDDDEDEGKNEHTADALEAVRSLDFLLGGGVGTSMTFVETQKSPLYEPKKVAKSRVMNWRRRKLTFRSGEHSQPLATVEKVTTTKKKVTQPLSMCMVTNDGQVHFFYALRVLLCGTSKRHNGNTNDGESMNNNTDLSFSFAALLLGSKLFATVNANVLPLSHPHASVTLSLVENSRVVLGDDNHDRGSNNTDRNSNDLFSRQVDHNADVKIGVNENDQNAHWSSLGLFDATIDPASIHMRTVRRSNTLTGSCITSDTNNSYLAVCGKGLRRIVHRGDRGHQYSSFVLGGFVTFVSLRHYTESRTIYLPFAPASIQPVYWAGMHFVALLGEKTSKEAPRDRRPYAMLVRVDCSQGVGRSNTDISRMMAPGILTSSEDEARSSTLNPARFQSLFIMFPSVKESLGSLSDLFTTHELDQMDSKAVAISSIPSSPPEILLSFQTNSFLFVANHSLSPPQGGDATATTNFVTLSTVVRPGRRALLDGRSKDQLPLGWSLVGTRGANARVYFICWDGAVDDNQGPFIFPFHPTVLSDTSNVMCLNSSVMPLMSYVRHAEKVTECSRQHSTVNPPTTPAYSHQHAIERFDFSLGVTPDSSYAVTLNESLKLAANIEGGLDRTIIQALESISTQRYQAPEGNAKSLVGSGKNRWKILEMSHQEKSNRLLRQCSSWTMLEDSKENRGVINGQVIVAAVRFGSHIQSLTLRRSIVANPISTPFQTVLGWLCQQCDYCTAASVALSLLDDAEAVYELCGIPRSLEESMYHHKGLLDGIKPLVHDLDRGIISEKMVSLADMAVACLIKGGLCMSSTLEGFLARNKLYNAPRASIMLVGTLAAAVSKETFFVIEQTNFHNDIVDMVTDAGNPSEEVLWPLRCLMKVTVVRNCLPSAILMLNVAIPNELRWRAPKSKGLASTPRPSLGLFLSLSEIILESTENATRYFLQMMDEESGVPFWFSIEDDTRFALILMSIRGKRVMLQEPEVRMWALDRLHEEIKRSTTDSAYPLDRPLLTNGILSEIVVGLLCNAECYISQGMDAIDLLNSTSVTGNEDVACYHQDMLRVRDLLWPNNGYLDFDLVIAALLIMARRGCDIWREGTQISTQILLNTVCDLAGRKSDVEPTYAFDGATAMRQCALVENLQAAAFLVGGKKGLIIECMDLLVSILDLTVQDAETMLFVSSLIDLKRDVPLLHEEECKYESDPTIFVPSESHSHLLWLLLEHVLNVHTYGEFDSETHGSTGKVTPVFAGRICFRAWYCLTSPSALCSSALWLESWLRRHLELSCGKSPKRLACAALVRVLLWVDESEYIGFTDSEMDDDEEEEEEEEHPTLLATVMGLQRQFLAELAQACCGLIQSIPPHIAEELMSSCTAAGGPKVV